MPSALSDCAGPSSQTDSSSVCSLITHVRFFVPTPATATVKMELSLESRSALELRWRAGIIAPSSACNESKPLRRLEACTRTAPAAMQENTANFILATTDFYKYIYKASYGLYIECFDLEIEVFRQASNTGASSRERLLDPLSTEQRLRIVLPHA